LPQKAQPVTPERAGAPPPALSTPHLTFGAGLQYRSGQAVRPLFSVSSSPFSVRARPAGTDGTRSHNTIRTCCVVRNEAWGVTSFQGTGGTENRNGLGSLSWQNDYIGFGKLHHRLSLSVTGKTDSHANRLLGSNAETNERQTGGQARLEYNLVNDWHGVYVQLFGQGARENLAFSGSATNIPNTTLWTADTGATIDLLHESRPWPGRFEITPQVHFGNQTLPVTTSYTVWSLDASAHQRISDLKLISVDISGHFRNASKGTPIFELPALGGGDSLRDSGRTTSWRGATGVCKTSCGFPCPARFRLRPAEEDWEQRDGSFGRTFASRLSPMFQVRTRFRWRDFLPAFDGRRDSGFDSCAATSR